MAKQKHLTTFPTGYFNMKNDGLKSLVKLTAHFLSWAFTSGTDLPN